MSNDTQHILIVSSWYPTAIQPFLGNFVERHASLLATNYKVTVLTIESGALKKRKITTQRSGNLTVVRAIYKDGGKIRTRLRKEMAFKSGLNSIENADLVIGHIALPLGWAILKAAKHFNCPLFYVEHGSYFRPDKLKSLSLYQRQILRKLSRVAVERIAVSERLKTDMGKFLSQEITVIGNHIDVDLFKPTVKNSEPKKQFLHISTLDVNTKNPKGIIDACALLAAETSNFNLTIISDEDPTEIAKYASECGVDAFVSFLGPFSWKEIASFYSTADAFVLFSDYETFSIVLAEAYSTGTPVITTPVGIAPETSDSTTIVVQKGDTTALKDAMLAIINNTHSFDSEALTAVGTNYSGEKILSQWKAILKKHDR